MTFTVLLTFPSCGGKDIDREGKVYTDKEAPAFITGVDFVKVPVTAFTFNETVASRAIDGSSYHFETVEPSFWISTKPVPMSLYEAYFGMGKLPKSGLCYDDAQALLDRMYLSTSIPFVLPSESMFEAALSAGVIAPAKNTQFLMDDGWNSVDMPKDFAISWKAPVTGSNVVLRSVYERSAIERFRRRPANQFYIAMRTGEKVPNNILSLLDYMNPDVTAAPSDGKAEVLEVDGVKYELLPVKGGTMTLGATENQERYAENDELPLHEESLDDFKIGKTEVTVGLWMAIMGELPYGNDRRYPNRPVVNVSWYDCQELILKLRERTGKAYRLPNENEWEYAARGGVKTHGYVFAGGNNAKDYVVCTMKAEKGKKKGENIRPPFTDVATKLPNELGLYDMSGNVWEWVRGPHMDGKAVLRGGSRLSTNVACRVSNRQSMMPGDRKDTFGLRLAL